MKMVQTEHELLAESLGALRAKLEAARGAASAHGNTAEALASALSTHLAAVNPTELPLPAQVIWIDRVVRPLKADGSKPLPARSFAAIRSWPASRVAQLAASLAEIEAIVAEAHNDAEHEVIYAEISRTYS
ncbi:MAG: hypothetical protein SFW09_15610 [Hyphomicrobiaceae bacterium]|nr:hypothetical protein [Hyphomicrobiaceae bacterium]